VLLLHTQCPSSLTRSALFVFLTRSQPEQLLNQLEAVLYSLVSLRRPLFQIRKTAVEQVRGVCMWASTACSTPRPSTTATTATSLAVGLPMPMPMPMPSSAASMLHAMRLLPGGDAAVVPATSAVHYDAGTLQQQMAILQGWELMQAIGQAAQQHHTHMFPTTFPLHHHHHQQHHPQCHPHQHWQQEHHPPQQLLFECQPALSAQLGGVMRQPLAILPQHHLQHMLHALWLQGQQQHPHG
jgi:hypothetical protein